MAKKKTAVEQVKAFKGFNKDMKCREYQFTIGETFTHDGEVQACASGFHSCEYPLDVFNYYDPANSRFAAVTAIGKLSRHNDSDSKIASASIRIDAEITIPDMVTKAVEWIFAKVDFDNAKETNTGYRSAATNTGNRSAATNTGDCSAATNTGDYSAATNTGNQSAATNTGYQSAATNTGDCSAATNTGDCSAATVEGLQSVAIATGYQGKAKAAAGSAICLVFRDDDYNIVHIKAGIAGKDIKPDTFYILDSNGEFKECE